MIADEVGVSSATIRNEMVELIELGLLEQPHTSTGHYLIPSQRGYREYIDGFMDREELPERLKLFFDGLLFLPVLMTERNYSKIRKSSFCRH